MGVLNKIGRFVIDSIVLVSVITFLPGLPPKGEYATIQLDAALPREGALAHNSILDQSVRLFDGHFNGPESIASRGKANEIYVSMHGGSIVRVYGENYSRFKEVAKIGPGCKGKWEEQVCGRPLGLRFSRDGKLLVADAYLGIFKVDVDTGKKELLFDPQQEINDVAPRLIDDLDEDSEGNLYWSDASTLADLSESTLEIAAGPSGRLVKYNINGGHNLVLLDKLQFANGVQLSPQQDFVLVCETIRHRIIRYWLKGPKAGTHDNFITGLPGFPDNIRSKPGGGYYVSLVTVKDPSASFDFGDSIARWPSLRRLVARVLYGTKKLFEGIGYLYDNDVIHTLAYNVLNSGSLGELFTGNRSMVVVLDAEGLPVSSLQGTSGAVRLISETHEQDGRLFFGSPYNSYLGMLELGKLGVEEGQTHGAEEGTKQKHKQEL